MPERLQRVFAASALVVLVARAALAAGGDPAPAPHREDLTCALASGLDAAAAAGLPAFPADCGCASPAPACGSIELAGDRRRAVVLAPGSRRQVALRASGHSLLRLSVGVTSPQRAQLAFHVRVRDGRGQALREWQRIVPRWGGWVDVDLDLAGMAPLDPGTLEIEVDAGPVSGPNTAAVVANPRLLPLDRVRPVTDRPAAPAKARPALVAGRPRARNLVVYLVDTLRADHTSVYGYARPTTPHLERFARQAITFDRAYSVASWTRVAVASLFSGLRPGVHRVQEDTGLPASVDTLAERFRRAGWSTWGFVTNVQVIPRELGFDQGFDSFRVYPGEDGGVLARTSEVDPFLFAQLQKGLAEDFLLYVHTVDPHAPYDPPDGYAGLFSDPDYAGSVGPFDTLAVELRSRDVSSADLAHVRDLYDEDVRFQDEMLGAFLDRLASTGLDQDTVVVVLSDHGEEFLEHGEWEHGERLFENLVRIPLMIRLPGRRDLAGRRITEPVQIDDVMPTLLDWFGLPAGGEIQGRSLAPLFESRSGARGRGRAVAPVPPVVCEEIRPTYDLSSIRRDDWKLIRREALDGTTTHLLFDLRSDPGEQRDLASSQQPRVAQMDRQLAGILRHDAAARKDVPADQPVAIPEEARRRLEALGYVGSGPSDAAEEADGPAR